MKETRGAIVFLFRVTPFSLKKIWKYRESINVSCKAMDKPFDP